MIVFELRKYGFYIGCALFAFFEGQTSEQEAIEKIKQHTRNYAKRQITYFNNRFSTEWIQPADWVDFIRKFAKSS